MHKQGTLVWMVRPPLKFEVVSARIPEPVVIEGKAQDQYVEYLCKWVDHDGVEHERFFREDEIEAVPVKKEGEAA